MMELVSLAASARPDWAAARAYVDALVAEEVGEDVLALCGVDPESVPQPERLEAVKERLRADLERFRGDVEGDRDEIEVWEVGELLVLASVGAPGDEADPDRAHGWLCRLTDSGALAAAGFRRARKADLLPLG